MDEDLGDSGAADDGACPLGLGYYNQHYSPNHSSLSSSPADAIPTDQVQASTMTPVDVDAAMIQQYMRQCLDYHGRQEEIRSRQRQELEGSVAAGMNGARAPDANFVGEHQFVSAQIPEYDTTRNDDARVPDPLIAPTGYAAGDTDAATSRRTTLEEGRARAQAILEKFHRQQQNLLLVGTGIEGSCRTVESEANIIPPAAEGLLVGGTANEASAVDWASMSSLYIQQRKRGFEREAVRKCRALVRNLEYVSRKEVGRLQQLNADIETSRQLQAHADQRYHALLEERKKQHKQQKQMSNLNSQAAIGSGERKRVERQKKKRTFAAASSSDGDVGGSVAVYLSGFPTDGTVDESFLSELFVSFGRIRKVHLYRHKGTDILK